MLSCSFGSGFASMSVTLNEGATGLMELDLMAEHVLCFCADSGANLAAALLHTTRIPIKHY